MITKSFSIHRVEFLEIIHVLQEYLEHAVTLTLGSRIGGHDKTYGSFDNLREITAAGPNDFTKVFQDLLCLFFDTTWHYSVRGGIKRHAT